MGENLCGEFIKIKAFQFFPCSCFRLSKRFVGGHCQDTKAQITTLEHKAIVGIVVYLQEFVGRVRQVRFWN